MTPCSLLKSVNSLLTWYSTQACSGRMRHTEEIYYNTGGLTNVPETCAEGMPTVEQSTMGWNETRVCTQMTHLVASAKYFEKMAGRWSSHGLDINV